MSQSIQNFVSKSDPKIESKNETKTTKNIVKFMDEIVYGEGRLFSTSDVSTYELIDFGDNSGFPERYLGIIHPRPSLKRVIAVKFGEELDILGFFYGVNLNREVECYRLDINFPEFEAGKIKHSVTGKELDGYLSKNFPELLI